MMFERFYRWCNGLGGIEPVPESLDEELERLQREFRTRQREIERLKEIERQQIKEREKQIQRDFGVFMAGSGRNRR
jgi:hypothetical protein